MSMQNDNFYLLQYGHSGRLIQEMRRITDAVCEPDELGTSVMDHLEQFAHTLLLVERLDSYHITGQDRVQKVSLFDLRYPYGLDLRWSLA
jgi:hypothetical protein